MSYQSPLHIVENFDIDPANLSQEEIIRIRKKLLAEFNLTGETTINIKGKEYTKDEIINQIDTLKNIEDLETHIEIFSNKEVLEFCENPKKSHNPISIIQHQLSLENTTFNYRSIVIDAELTSLKYKFTNLDYQKVHFILQFLYHINFEDAEEAYDIIDNQLNGLAERLDDINKLNYHDEAAWLMKIFRNKYFFRCINELPDELYWLKNSLVVSLINISTRIYKLNEELTIELSWNLTSLDCSPEHKELIESNHAVYTGKERSSSSLDEIGIIRIVLFILYILYMIYR
ncbi:MAG: hypothetical protein HYZ42_00890 [Bacteroidetes bacterium]|nr:hypothetical protein [Bacteroidota bacterium]